jgi:hypothetical protein
MSQNHLSEQSIAITDLHQRGRAIFENLRSELMQSHYNWFILIEPESGDYFVDRDEIVALTKARENHPQVPFTIFRLNETGLCGRV